MRLLEHLPMLTTVALTLLLTLVLPQIMRRLRLPGVVGWILAGVLLGPHLSGVLHTEGQFVAVFAEIGKLMLMFFAGFEIDFREFNRTKRQSAIFGALTFSLPFLAGAAVALTAGYGWNTCLVVGAILASHTLLGLPIFKDAGLMGREAVVVTVGATVFTDTLSILVLAICLPIHLAGFSGARLLGQIVELAIYVPAILFGLAWIVRRALSYLGDTKANRAAIPLIAMVIAAQGAEWIELEGIIGAFLAGIAVKRGFGETRIEDSLEVMGQTLFIPLFFVASGFLVDFRVFYATLVGQPLLVLGIVGALLGGKWLAARLCGAIVGYPAADRAAMFALSVPQVAATLAVALVAYGAKNAAGERLIDQPILNATIVLVVVTSLGGLLLAGRAVAAMGGVERAALKTSPAG